MGIVPKECQEPLSVGPNPPSESDVAVFERFFDTHMAHLSEYAVMSFISLCRITSLPIFAAFAQIMRTQMVRFRVKTFSQVCVSGTAA